MPTHSSPLRFGFCSSLRDTKIQLPRCLVCLLLFDGLTQKSTKLPALSTGRCIASGVISGTQTRPRDWWLTHRQYHGWHDKTSDGWHSWHSSLAPAMTAPHGWQNTLTDFFYTYMTHAHIYFFFLKSIPYIMYMSYPQTHRAYFSHSYSLWCSHAKVISLSYTRTRTDTHRHKHHPIFQIRLFHGSFPPSSPLKMTVADISTHSEGKRADISSWVTKLGSNYIALSRQPWLLLTRPDIWSVSAGYQFCSLPPVQHWADSLCYIFWMRSWPIRYCFTGRMVSLSRYKSGLHLSWGHT